MEYTVLREVVDETPDFKTIQLPKPITQVNEKRKAALNNDILNLAMRIEIKDKKKVKSFMQRYFKCVQTAFYGDDVGCMEKLKRDMESEVTVKRKQWNPLYYCMIFVSHVTAYSVMLTYAAHSETMGSTVKMLISMYSNFVDKHCSPAITTAIMTIMTTVTWRTMKYTRNASGLLTFVVENKYKGGLLKQLVTRFLVSAISLVFVTRGSSFMGINLSGIQFGNHPPGHKGSIKRFLDETQGSTILHITTYIETALAALNLLKWMSVPVNTYVQLLVRISLTTSGKVAWSLLRLMMNATLWCTKTAKKKVVMVKKNNASCPNPKAVKIAIQKGMETPVGTGGGKSRQDIAKVAKQVVKEAQQVNHIVIYLITRGHINNHVGFSTENLTQVQEDNMLRILAERGKRLVGDTHALVTVKSMAYNQYQKDHNKANVPYSYPTAFIHAGGAVYMDSMTWFSPPPTRRTPTPMKKNNSKPKKRNSSSTQKVQKSLQGPHHDAYTIYIISNGNNQSIQNIQELVGITPQDHVVVVSTTSDMYRSKFQSSHRMIKKDAPKPYALVHTPLKAVIYVNLVTKRMVTLVPPRKVYNQGNAQKFLMNNNNNNNNENRVSTPLNITNANEGPVSSGSVNQAMRGQQRIVDRLRGKIIRRIVSYVTQKVTSSGEVFVTFRTGKIWVDHLKNASRALAIPVETLNASIEDISDAFDIPINKNNALTKHYVKFSLVNKKTLVYRATVLHPIDL